jgi:hypothetical protein
MSCFQNDEFPRAQPVINPVSYTRTAQDNGDRFWWQAKLPGQVKTPMDVVSVNRPRYGRDM